MNNPQIDAILHAQKVARRIGAMGVSMEVYSWTLKHAKDIPAEAVKELLDIVSKEEYENRLGR